MSTANWKLHCAIGVFRTWAAARESHEPVLPRCVVRAQALNLSSHAAVACASLYELLENQLRRPLVPECCCSKQYSKDEQVIIALLLTQIRSDFILPTDSPLSVLAPAVYAAARALDLTSPADAKAARSPEIPMKVVLSA